MSSSNPDVVLAAGAVCWRIVKGTVKVLLVHRDDRADVSLPKGKVDPGETLPQTAVREIEEETGLRVALGAPLGSIEYSLGGGRQKIVHYWAAEVTSTARANSTFAPNSEIAAVEWLPLDRAKKALSYERDKEVLDRFSALLDSGRLRTFALIVVRRGKAVPPTSWDGPDSTRPLLHRGLEQAATIAPAIAAFRPEKLVSSSAARCQSTLDPLATLIALPLAVTDDISQDAFEHHDARVEKVVRRRLAKKVTAVLCSHGPVIPEIVHAIAQETGSSGSALRNAARLSTGEYSVFHVSAEHPDGGIVAIETHAPLLG
ncbi:8-oxo-dGTP diphosphatase [Cryobacterium mesophilum]|uniref:NUDIX hydrolase n=1 Tax=Terrimesophilobacter mesophilus TaxID=433647 RepID=A0A4R8VA16_9MICO|nr:NUDIX hydrolase [Terrimesophilobacter mesophilus]MBB5632791.1 8-oxo-dGTP diphosphatase [Terrimesophilobacter mesophilus]TFB79583.1 NUDIX hydrolase [Terrimesophilobacter mesophilus]